MLEYVDAVRIEAAQKLIQAETVAAEPVAQSRLVAAVGTSIANPKRRWHDDGRGRLGPTGKTFGATWDKGHFIAHSLGGAVDGLEANVFLQPRTVNRGGYREMERYCAANPGVLCFNRPFMTMRRRFRRVLSSAFSGQT